MAGPVDVFESPDTRALPRRWSDLPPRLRFAGAALLVLLAVVIAVVVVRHQVAARRAAERVALTVSLGVATSTNSPPGGAVNYALLVRNDGAVPLVVTTVTAGSERLVLRPWETVNRRVAPGAEVQIAMSVRLVCGGVLSRPPGGMGTEVHVRRPDGSTVVRHGTVTDAGQLLDVAGTLCSVRPGLRGQELSGPLVPGQN